MAKKTPAADLSGLVATKGRAVPVANMPLNFRVSGEFRRRFRMYAAAHDLKLNELLRLAFDEYEQRNKD